MNWSIDEIATVVGSLYLKIIELQKKIDEQDKIINEFVKLNPDLKDKVRNGENT